MQETHQHLQSQHQTFSESADHSTSSSYEDAAPFFADMTLDLDEAHGFAETPELTQKTLIDANKSDLQSLARKIPPMPQIPDTEYNHLSTTMQSRPREEEAAEEADNHVNDGGGGGGGGDTNYTEPTPQSFQFQDHNPQDDMPQVMGRVTSSDPGVSARRGRGNASNIWMRGAGGSRRTRQWPKDVSWTIAFGAVIPTSLILPLLLVSNNNDNDTDDDGTKNDNESSIVWLATARASQLATFHTLLWGFAAALVLSRLLYRTPGGGEGDDARHLASQILLASAPISVSVYIFILIAIHVLTPHGKWIYSIIPLWYLARDVYLFRRWKMTSTTPGGRQAFFQALTCMTLDILSRSLRRLPFWRCILAVLVAQFLVIAWWRMALLAALQSGNVLFILLTAVGGKWATGFVARLLSLVACGGIGIWFAEQSSLVEDLQQQQQQQQEPKQHDRDKGRNELNDDEEEVTIEFANIPKDHSYDQEGDLPEAYRNVDASAYRSVLQLDEVMDDDFEDEDDDFESAALYMRGGSGTGGGRRSIFTSGSNQRSSIGSLHQQQQQRSGSTVKQLLVAGLSVSFGSVTKCGLLGGMAQFVWSQIRKIDHARATFGRLQGMEIRGGHERDGGSSEGDGFLKRMMLRVNGLARDFVQNNSDMAMSFVALYKMAYSPAAREVALVVDESGVEPIIHDDISTHISSCVGGSVSGMIVVFTGAVLAHQRNQSSPDVPDSAVILDMLLSFFFCYTLIFTVMEPLRASIKAVYVSFAQHPESLSAAFPLIYHRLTRMSQSNLQ